MKNSSTNIPPQRLYRSTQNKMIAGVAAGLGEYLNIDPTIIRIIFIILALFHGSGILLYIIMWLILPSQTNLTTVSQKTVRDNVDDFKDTVQSFAHNLHFRSSTSPQNSRFIWAILIIALGFFFLFRNFGIFDSLDLGKFWPIILIVLGVIFILRR